MFQRKAGEDRSQNFSPDRTSVSSTSLQQSALANRKPNEAPPRAVLNAGISILGCLQTTGEIQVDGDIQGDIRCAHLTVGKTATIVGDILADEVVIRGKVKGTIRAKRVLLQDSAHVESDIIHDKIAIEEGAYFKGSSTHNGGKEINEPGPQVAALGQMITDMKATA
jgi:cytoskeletal protein CcmA (bactofilin family)